MRLERWLRLCLVRYGTDIVGVVIQLVNGLLHKGFSLLDTIVRFPVTTDESLISGEEVSEDKGIEHIFEKKSKFKNIYFEIVIDCISNWSNDLVKNKEG